MFFDELFLLFKSNAKDVKKDTDEAGRAVDNFEKKIRDSDKSANQLGDTFGKLVETGVKAMGAYASFATLKNLAVNTYNTNLELEKTHRLLDEDARTIAVWDASIVQAGGSAGEFTGWLKGINQEMVDMGQGNRIPQILQNLRNLSKEWHDAGLSRSQMLAQGHKYGLPDSIILLMQEGPEKMDAIIEKQRTLNSYTEKGGQAARDFANQWESSSNKVTQIFTTMEGAMLPFFTKLLNVLTNMLNPKPFMAMLNLMTGDVSDIVAAGRVKHSAAPAQAQGGAISNKEESRRFWMAQGYTAAQTAGWMGGEYGESKFDPRAVGDGGRAIGIAQWHPDRRAAILRGTGIDVTTASHYDQLRAMHWEAQQRGDDARMRATTTPEQAAAVHTQYFERPADIAGESYKRGMYARQFYQENIKDMAAAAKQNVAMADTSPINQASAPGNTSTSMTIGAINIQTQAQDAQGIAREVRAALNEEFRNTIGNSDTGVKW